MKAGLYIRVSTDMQVRDGESLAEQETSTQAYCNFRNIPIITIYREEGKSGKDTNRPQFQKMLRDCKFGKIDTIVVKKIDRLSRSLIDFEKTIKFFEDHNINLISIQENFDTSTAIGRAVIRIILTFAQLEREQTSERTIDVLKYRAEQGLWNGGLPPIGFDSDSELGLVVNISESKIVNIIFKKYTELASYLKVAQYVNNQGYRSKQYTSRRGKQHGGHKFTDTAIAGILKNPIYLGKIKYKGELYPGKHQPIVSEDIYTHVQEIIQRNTKRNTSINKRNKHNFILESLVKCKECGSYMSPKWTLSHSKRYFYYECSKVNHHGKNACPTKAISAIALESFILRRIRMIRKDNALLKKILENNTNFFQKDIYALESEKIILNIKLTEITTRSKNIVDKLLAIPELSHSTTLYDEVKSLDKEKNTMSQKIQDIDIRITKLKNRSYNIDIAKQSFKYFTQIYGRLSNNDKKILMGILIYEILYSNNYIGISYYTNIDNTSIPLLVDSEGAKPKLYCWQRPLTGSSQDSLCQKAIDDLPINTYRPYKAQTRIAIAVHNN